MSNLGPFAGFTSSSTRSPPSSPPPLSAQHFIHQNPKLSTYAIDKRINHPELSFNLFVDPEGRAYHYDHDHRQLLNEVTPVPSASDPSLPPLQALQHTTKRRDRTHPEPTRAHKHECSHSFSLHSSLPQGNFRGCSPRRPVNEPFQPNKQQIQQCLMIVKPNDPAYREWVKRSYDEWLKQEEKKVSHHPVHSSKFTHKENSLHSFPHSALDWASKFLRVRYAEANSLVSSSSNSRVSSVDHDLNEFWTTLTHKYQDQQKNFAHYQVVSGFDWAKQEIQRQEKLKRKMEKRKRRRRRNKEEEEEEEESHSDKQSEDEEQEESGEEKWYYNLNEPSNSDSDSSSSSSTDFIAEPGVFYSGRIFHPSTQWQNRSIHHVRPQQSIIHGKKIFHPDENAIDRINSGNKEEQERIMTLIAEKIQSTSMNQAQRQELKHQRIQQRQQRKLNKQWKQEMKEKIQSEMKKESNRWMSKREENQERKENDTTTSGIMNNIQSNWSKSIHRAQSTSSLSRPSSSPLLPTAASSIIRPSSITRTSSKPSLPISSLSSQVKGFNQENPILKIKQQQLAEDRKFDSINLTETTKRAQKFIQGKLNNTKGQTNGRNSNRVARGKSETTQSRINNGKKPVKQTINKAVSSTSVNPLSSPSSRSISKLPVHLMKDLVPSSKSHPDEVASDTSEYSSSDIDEERTQAALKEMNQQSENSASKRSNGPDLRAFHQRLINELRSIGIEIHVESTDGHAQLISDKQYQAEIDGIEQLIHYIRNGQNQFQLVKQRLPMDKDGKGNVHSAGLMKGNYESKEDGPIQLNLRDALRIREILRKRQRAMKEANEKVLEELRRQEFLIIERAKAGLTGNRKERNVQQGEGAEGEGDLVATWIPEPFWYEKRGVDFRDNLIAYNQVLRELDAHYTAPGRPRD
jgi:hypothetical protein